MIIDFDQSCVLLSAILTLTAVKRYRLICLVLFFNFALSEFSANSILDYLDGRPSWPLHAVYALISGLTVMALSRMGCTKFLYWAIYLFAIINYVIISEFIWGSIGFHDNFAMIAKSQMVIELMSMLIMNKGSRYVWAQLNSDRSYVYIVDRIFVNRFRLGFKGSI